MKLSEIKGDRALDVLAELIEPVAEICADKEIASILRAGTRIKAVKPILKNHKRAIVDIMAALDGVEPENYQMNLLTLPLKLLELLNDPELMRLFTSAEQTEGASSSGSASDGQTLEA